jgi:predicted aspartyl protease
MLNACAPKLIKPMAGAYLKSKLTAATAFPTEFIRNRIYIKVILPGITDDTLTFLFDTGAPTIISPALANTLKLPTTDFIQAADVNGKVKQLPIVKLPRIQIGTVVFRNVSAMISKIPDQDFCSAVQPVEGVIGANLLGLAAWQIDLEKNQLIMLPQLPSNIPPNSQQWKVKPDRQGTPWIELTLAGQNTRIKLDTGSPMYIGLPISEIEKWKPLAIATFTGRGIRSTGFFGMDTGMAWRLRLPKCSLLQNNPAVVADVLNENGHIGLRFLAQSQLLFDTRKKIAFFISPANRMYNTADWGYTYVIVEQKLYISLIYDQSPAAIAGLQVGDQLLAINELSLENISQPLLCHYIAAGNIKPNLPALTIKIKRNESVIEFKINQLPTFENN